MWSEICIYEPIMKTYSLLIYNEKHILNEFNKILLDISLLTLITNYSSAVIHLCTCNENQYTRFQL